MFDGIISLLVLGGIGYALYLLTKRGVGRFQPKQRAAINPDFQSDTLAINSKTGDVWMMNFRKELVVNKSQILSLEHRWTNQHGAVRSSTAGHHIVFTLSDLTTPRFVVNFASANEANLWASRMEAFHRASA